jgi:hypothetical protein
MSLLTTNKIIHDLDSLITANSLAKLRLLKIGAKNSPLMVMSLALTNAISMSLSFDPAVK